MPAKQFIEDPSEMEAVLSAETLGYLGVIAAGAPYVVPLNYTYTGGKITFHGALDGQKMAALRANPQVCFTVGRQGAAPARHTQTVCHPDNDSVICYGTARILTDLDEKLAALNRFSQRLEPGAAEVSREAAQNCGVVEIQVSRMTGRSERDSRCSYWSYTFPA